MQLSCFSLYFTPPKLLIFYLNVFIHSVRTQCAVGSVADPDPHRFEKLNPDPVSHQSGKSAPDLYKHQKAELDPDFPQSLSVSKQSP